MVFGTKTLGSVYEHTKPVCDRLKGASLLEVKTINVKGYNLTAYKIQQCTGEVEFAINLSAGTATNRNTISLQSNWFTSNYQQDEVLYNFQLWAVSYQMVAAMANDIIVKLQDNGTITQTNTTNNLPATYIAKGHRNGTVISLDIQNNTSNINGYFEMKEKLVEGGVETTRQMQFTIQPNNITNVPIAVSDAYEATINMYLNGEKVDMLYLNDGTWSKELSAGSTLNNFTVTADGNANANSNEYRLMRNVNITATTKDYVSVYKVIGTGCNALNINNYKSIKFSANTTGASSVTITLVSKNIADWKNQYSYTVNLDGNKEYEVALAQFKSKQYQTPVSSNEITAVGFAFNTSRAGINTNIYASIGKARFSKLEIANTTLIAAALGIYPNPSTGSFAATFTSEVNQSLVLKVVEAATGRIVKTQFITATKGNNKILVELNNNLTNGSYIVTLEGDGATYNASKLMVNKK